MAELDAAGKAFWQSLALDQDPAFQAYQRQLDAQRASKMIAAGKQMDLIKASGQRALDEIPIKGERARTNISGGFESRGLYRSGAHEKKLAEQRSDEARALANTQAEIQDRLSAISVDLALEFADLDRQKAESRLTYGSRYML